MGADWRDSQIRCLVHFDDGGSGMRYRDEPLDVGVELADGGAARRVISGRAWGTTTKLGQRAACA
jgi:hypothetical protein